MLSEERIEDLLEKINQGKEARKLLEEHKSLIDQKEHLEKIKNKCTNCRKITIEYAYNSNVAFDVKLASFALMEIGKIIDNEMECIDIKLNGIK